MSLFGADQVYTCLEKVYMVYTGLPPDEQGGDVMRWEDGNAKLVQLEANILREPP
jgi:hypothetical protein